MNAADSSHLREEVLAKLREAHATLRSSGVLHAALFGSVARGEANPASDIDILVELDRNAHIGLFAFAGLQIKLTEMLGRKVDLVSKRSLRKDRYAHILREAVEAF